MLSTPAADEFGFYNPTSPFGMAASPRLSLVEPETPLYETLLDDGENLLGRAFHRVHGVALKRSEFGKRGNHLPDPGTSPWTLPVVYTKECFRFGYSKDEVRHARAARELRAKHRKEPRADDAIEDDLIPALCEGTSGPRQGAHDHGVLMVRFGTSGFDGYRGKR